MALVPDFCLSRGFDIVRLTRKLTLDLYFRKKYKPHDVVLFYREFGFDMRAVSSFFEWYNLYLTEDLGIIDQVLKGQEIYHCQRDLADECWRQGLIDIKSLSDLYWALTRRRGVMEVDTIKRLEVFRVISPSIRTFVGMVTDVKVVNELLIKRPEVKGELRVEKRCAFTSVLQESHVTKEWLQVAPATQQLLAPFARFSPEGTYLGPNYREIASHPALPGWSPPKNGIPEEHAGPLFEALTERPYPRTFWFLERHMPDFWHKIVDGSDWSRVLFESEEEWIRYDHFLELIRGEATFEGASEMFAHKYADLAVRLIRAGVPVVKQKYEPDEPISDFEDPCVSEVFEAHPGIGISSRYRRCSSGKPSDCDLVLASWPGVDISYKPGPRASFAKRFLPVAVPGAEYPKMVLREDLQDRDLHFLISWCDLPDARCRSSYWTLSRELMAAIRELYGTAALKKYTHSYLYHPDVIREIIWRD